MDCVGNAPFSRVSASLNPGGALLLVIADLKGMLQAPRNSRRSGKLVTAGDPRLHYTAEDLAALVRLAEDGRYKAVIDRTYPLAEIVQAHRFVDTGRKRGNVIVKIAGESPKTERFNNPPLKRAVWPCRRTETTKRTTAGPPAVDRWRFAGRAVITRYTATWASN